jgi:hypothetical protein
MKGCDMPTSATMLALALVHAVATVGGAVPTLLFVADEANDFLVVAERTGALPTKRFLSVAEAVAAAAPGDGLLVMAEAMLPSNPGLPQNHTGTQVTHAEWASIQSKGLLVYLEFPASLPGGGTTQQQLQVAQTKFERVVVAAEGGLGPALGHLDLLHPHKLIDFVVLPGELLPEAELALAKVAGYDNATFGLPPNGTYPFLVSPAATPKLLLAATQLSYCRRRRFAPSNRWMAVAERILNFTSGGAWAAARTSTSASQLWIPTVGASFNRSESLPEDAERQAVLRGVDFYRNARLLPDAQRAVQLGMLFGMNVSEQAEALRRYARLASPYEANASGDGQLGIFEGLTSDIDIYGKQPQSNGVRADCVTESSASFAVRAQLSGNKSDARVATNLLNYGHIHSGYHQPWAVGAGQPDPYIQQHLKATRPWVVSGDAFGLMAWTTMDHSYVEYFSDDDARGLLGAVATAGLLRSERWHSTIATAVLGNLRNTPEDGFAPGSAGFAQMVDAQSFDPQHGWRKQFDSPGAAAARHQFSPHYESYIWAVYLWAYSRCGFPPLLERAQRGLTMMMENYPTKWVPTANGIAMQRARIILPLAFLVRANDTALHRQWLTDAIDGFATLRYCEGDWCAYREELSHPGWGASTGVPTSNAAYGTGEAPLNQENGDPVSDFLYTTNFALLGLHEAAAALPANATIKAEADKLATFIVRSQARSAERPELDGAWMRAFDFKKWEAWASDGDVGWGAWSVESGWTQSWITITLGMRVLNTSLWELGSSSHLQGIEDDFATWLPVMFPHGGAVPPPPPPPPPPPCLEAGANQTLFYTLVTADPALCAPAPGSNVSHVIFSGARCGGEGSKKIQWQSMHTVDPRPGLPGPGLVCTWHEGPGGDYTGGCGTCAKHVCLPLEVCH